MHSELGAPKTKGLNGKVKKRVKPPPVRARRRLMDPTKWDSVHLKGVFLDAVSIPSPTPKEALEPHARAKHNIVDEESESEEDSTDGDAFSSISQLRVRPSQPVPQPPSPQRPQEATLPVSSRTDEATDFIDVRGETSAALAMLGEMFGDKEDWDGRESADEMEGLEGNGAGRAIQVDDIEVVPCGLGEGERRKISERGGKMRGKSSGGFVYSGREDKVAGEVARNRDVEMEEISPPVSVEASAQMADPPPQTNLKALFAPREDGS